MSGRTGRIDAGQLPRRACGFRADDNRTGFSLLEFIVVMVIAAILVSVALLSMPDIQGARDRLAVDELSAHLRYIRNMAVSRERTTRIEFDVASNSYAAFIGGTVPVKDPVTGENLVVDIGVRFEGVTLASVDVSSGDILCFSETNGIPCDGATNPLTAQGTIQFGSGLQVSVTPDTGYVE